MISQVMCIKWKSVKNDEIGDAKQILLCCYDHREHVYKTYNALSEKRLYCKNSCSPSTYYYGFSTLVADGCRDISPYSKCQVLCTTKDNQILEPLFWAEIPMFDMEVKQ